MNNASALAVVLTALCLIPIPAHAQTHAGGASEAAPPAIQYDPGLLPEPVRVMRDRILEAAKSGEIENLRPVAESNETPPVFSFSNGGGDPIQELIDNSVDGEGREPLAILAEVLEAGYVHVDAGTPQEMYVWPYFMHHPLDQLTPPQMIEMLRIVTAAEYQDMRSLGTYNFYRVGIGPDGTWHFFVAGD